MFGREFPSKKCGEPLSWHILQDTIFFVKWRAENFAYGLLFVTKSFSYGLWFSGNNSISGATSLNSLRKECLVYELPYSKQRGWGSGLALLLLRRGNFFLYPWNCPHCTLKIWSPRIRPLFPLLLHIVTTFAVIKSHQGILSVFLAIFWPFSITQRPFKHVFVNEKTQRKIYGKCFKR